MTSAAGSRQSGFTLIELLAVLLIVGLLLSLSTIVLPTQSPAKAGRTEIDRLAALLKLAIQDAVLKSRRTGIAIRKHEYRFVAQNPQQQWEPLKDKLFAPRRLPPPLQLALQAATTRTPQIIISASGEITPFTLHIQSDDEQVRYTIRGSLTGHIAVQQAATAD